MSELDIINIKKEMEKVVELYATGHKISEIQTKTGLPIKRINEHLAAFRDYASQDRVIRERSKEVVLVVDQHFSNITRDLYGAVEEADLAGDYKAKITALKTIADVESKKVELLQKAGLLANNTMADQILEAEEKTKVLKEILREVVCADCRKEVMKRLSKISNTVEPSVIINES